MTGKVTDYKLMFEMIERNEPYPSIAALFGMKPHSIRYHAAKIGHSRTQVGSYGSMVRDYLSDMPIAAIQARYNCSHDMIYRALKHSGIAANRRRAV